ncbi:c-type cytochrome [Blastomonas sp.]|uniref:c-type cytochrome n=1 Tax=Blastomonas sp. TaxID=1909299 RepID=UPI00261C40A0|nr:c-type cytochrome [Blastomonas sp.]MDM7957072.1 c-type cytochrome [Blastomonas sp.]
MSLKSLSFTIPAASLALASLVVTSPVLSAAQSPAMAGDAARGAKVYQSNCTGCHAPDTNSVGPAHRGVYGRKAGSAPGFAYSPGLKKGGFAWDAARLDAWLTNPQAFIPGAKMAFRLTSAQSRADVIAYLKQGAAQ